MYLSQRLRGHVNKYRSWKKGGLGGWVSSFDVLSDDSDEYEIVLIENYPCNTVDEAKAREKYWIENVEGGCVNKFIPSGRYTPEERAVIDSEAQKAIEIIQCECGGHYKNTSYKKERHEASKKHLYFVEHGKPDTRDKRKEWIEAHQDQAKAYMLKYRENNKTALQEKWKERYQANREQIIQKSREWYDANLDRKKAYDKEYRARKKAIV
jgi:hypothetical protein